MSSNNSYVIMKSNIKLSTSRKPFHKLSTRQQSRIMRRKIMQSRIKENLSFQSTRSDTANVESHKSSLVCEYSYSSRNIQSDNIEIAYNENVESDTASCSSSTTSKVSNVTLASSSCSTSSSEPSFCESLAACFVDNNITHVQGNNILSILRRHVCFSDLPKDVRTLLNTPRQPVTLYTVHPGKYVHFNLETGIIQSLENVSFVPLTTELEIDFNTDGCMLDKSSTIHLWPIQCRLPNVQNSKPIVVGVYKGTHKPHDPNIFFERFVSDVTAIMSKGGINFHGNRISIKLRCFIADAPARAFILNHRSHMSAVPCSKCKVSGTLRSGHYVFNGINHRLRTDQEYISCIDEEHHKEGTSPLSLLPIGIVSQVPFEYMHLVCLGVMKKLLSAWVQGKYSRLAKLSGISIDRICVRLNIFRKFCPSDFARRPTSLELYSKYKATELRQFLLYTGPIVTRDILDEQLYKHFLLLHGAMRVLVSKSPSRQQLTFAELALNKFVLRCELLYGPNFNSYNVHGLLHLTDDVKRFGNLDSFSAFPYENNMSMFRKYFRKPSLPLQQICNRMSELRQHGLMQRNIDSSIRVSQPRNKTRHCNEYCKIQFNGILISTHLRDNCCMLNDGSICIVKNILVENNCYRLVVTQFLQVDNFHTIGIISSALNVYKCGNLDREWFTIDIDNVKAKCYRMPFFDDASLDDSNNDGNDMEYSEYVVATIIHEESI